jgi:tetratricopeptide (TPR) repeat protein
MLGKLSASLPPDPVPPGATKPDTLVLGDDVSVAKKEVKFQCVGHGLYRKSAEDLEEECAKNRLVEELKNRAKDAFALNDMKHAEMLYGEAINMLDTMHGKMDPTLFSNRALVRLNLNKVEESLQDSQMCLDLDPLFVKAWHRRAQALLRLCKWDEAIVAAEEAAKVGPHNQAFLELIQQAVVVVAADSSVIRL